MLVLSRRIDEKILLPTVPAVIKVIGAQPGVVRLGFEAPSNVPILREELCQDEPVRIVTAESDEPAPEFRHAVRNRLHNLLLGLTLLRMQLAQSAGAVRTTLDGMERELQSLRRALAASEAGEPVSV